MSTEDLDQARQPPAGLSRKERRAWREAEGERLASLRPVTGDPLLASLRPPVAPRRLGRAGRKAWRDTERENRSHRLRQAVAAEAASGESDRYVGALVLMAAVLVIVLLRLFVFGGGSPEPTQSPTGPAQIVVTPTVTPTPRYDPSAPALPSTAPHTWAGE